MNNAYRLLVLTSMLLAAPCSHAQLFSVDIDGTVRPDVTDPLFQAWYMAPQTGSGISSATQSFTNYVYTYDPDSGLPLTTNISGMITCTMNMTYPAAATSTLYLNANYANKSGNSTSTDPNVGWRLSEDGCWAHWKDDSITVDQPYTNGGALSLTISGLSAGVHSLTTYHNDLWGSASGGAWHGTNTMSRCIISVGGVALYTNVPSNYATNDSQCGFAFFYVTNSYDGEPVVLNFNPDHSSVLDFVVLNGFEIDRPSPPGTSATAVFPTPGNEHAPANDDVPLPGTANAGYLALQWQPAGFALTNYLYFGTSSNAVNSATSVSPEFQGVSPALPGLTNSFNITNLNSALTYYWRVDQLDTANGQTNLVKGPIWEFRTRHLAFPTAEGYGQWSRGGRGGVVIEVTNLNDSGPGSYRAAISASGPRTVVFKVSGLIRLQSQCIIGNGYLTIAGQTAPGDGICIANWRAGMSGPNDVIMRYMRFRVGDAAQQSMDAMSPGSATHTIVDHCSSSWSLDVACNSLQSGSVGSQAAMTSYQHNIISEPLRYSYHYNDQERAATGCTNCYAPHAFAASISGEIGSYHHNLIAHSTDRNWSLAGGLDQSQHYGGSLDIRNNVVYNWTARSTDGGVSRLNYVNNYYKPYTPNNPVTWLLKLDPINTNWGTLNIYMAGNVMQGQSYFANNWSANSFYNGLPLTGLITNGAELYPSYVATQTATNAYKVVLSDVGCDLPARDLIDQRVIGEVLDGTTHYEGTNGPNYTINGVLQDDRGSDTPGMIDSQTDVHDYTNDITKPNYSPNYPWGPYATYNASLDTDHDGLPDWWERIKGLNTNSAPGDFSDANADLVGDGYTELERYLGWLALPHFDCTNNATLNVDLTQYTRGFTNNSPVYAVFGASGGTVVLSGTTAQFTPTTGVDALGSFAFAVTDASGFSYTNTVNVHILGDGTGPTAAPNAPTGVIAMAGNTQVSLNWTASSNATTYIIQSSTMSGGPYNSIATNASTSYLISGLANGTTYYYVVSAVNAIGVSPNSAEVSATPLLALPGIPTGLNAVATNSQVSLSWTASSGATSYIVSRATVDGGPYTGIITNAATGYVDAGLANGTTYYYVVSGVNASGTSANSSQASATPRIPAPTGLMAVAGDTQISLNWTASAGATGYVVQRATVNGGPYTSIITNTTTTYTNTGLANGVTYYFVVSAVNGSSGSLNSLQAFSTPFNSSGSGPFAYDSFGDYSVGTTIANNTITGGIGWAGDYGIKPTSTSFPFPYYTNGLVYSGLLTSGNAVQLGGANSQQYLLQHMLPATLGAMSATNGGTLWLSYLFYNPSYSTGTGGYYRESALNFIYGATTSSPNAGTGLGAIGMPNGSSTVSAAWSVWTSRTENGSVVGTVQSGLSAFSPAVQLVVLRMDINTTTNTVDNIYLWVNPPIGGTAPDISTALLTNNFINIDAINAFRFTATGLSGVSSNASYTLDEVRLGASFASVTPPNASAVNTAPVLSPMADRTVNAGVVLNITNTATDADVPAQTLTYNLSAGPTNATLGTISGIFNWRPLVTQANTTNPVTVVVTDNGTPSLSATQSFSVIVNPLSAPSVAPAAVNNGLFNLTINGQSGPDYGVQVSTNLMDWSMLLITNSPALPFVWTDSGSTNVMRFYRVKMGPPLP